jgi:hypothetical protein
MADDLRGRIADAILAVTYPTDEWPEGPPGEGEMDVARTEADAALAVIAPEMERLHEANKTLSRRNASYRDARDNIQKHLAETFSRFCICNTGPDTDGPEEDCPLHGRAEFAPRALLAALAEAEADRDRARNLSEVRRKLLREAWDAYHDVAADRDRARVIAVALEQEIARLTERIAELAGNVRELAARLDYEGGGNQ